MENQLFQDTPINEREAMLEANCLRPEEKLVKKHYAAEEVVEMRKQFLENNIVIKKAGEILSVAKSIFNETVASPVKDNVYLLANVRSGFVEVNQQVYLFDDQEKGMMNTYDATGELIESRRLTPEERQTRIKS